jgi:protein-tyrosine-phosphatase
MSTEASRQRTRPQSILFACTFNTIRSPMAEALARHYGGRRVYVDSAGVRAGAPNGFAMAVMEEVGLDISGFRPKTFDHLEDSTFDQIITLSPPAHHRALDMARTMAIDVVYWPMPDPDAVEGSREERLSAYRALRILLEERIRSMMAAWGQE